VGDVLVFNRRGSRFKGTSNRIVQSNSSFIPFLVITRVVSSSSKPKTKLTMASSTETDGSEDSLVLTVPRLVPTIHKAPYPSLLPSRPELSQSGRTILITGGSAGIGFAIARAYAEASASNIILTGRRSAVLHQASSKLSDEFPRVNIIPRVCNVASTEETAKLWSSLSDDGIFVDVLVLNAAKFGQQQQPLLETNFDETWSLYETNVKAILDFCQRLHKQPGAENRKKA
jgi:hypothetical protein